MIGKYVLQNGPKLFQITSSNSDDVYVIIVGPTVPSCTCMHWMQTEMLCKHLFAIMHYYNITWEQLPEQFR